VTGTTISPVEICNKVEFIVRRNRCASPRLRFTPFIDLMSTPMPDTLYTVKNLAFAYEPGKKVLDVDLFHVSPGEFVALIGPNGAGKSTLLKILSGLIKPASGVLEFKGKKFRDISSRELAKKVAYLPQDDEVHFPFTVGEVVMLGRWPHTGGAFFDSARDIEISSDAMKRVGISDWSGRLINELSGGERARVLLAKAIATQPECMLLDEPVSNLDIKYRAEAYAMLRSLVESGVGIVVVAHDIGSMSRWADRMVLLAGGKIVVDGAPSDVLKEDILERAYGLSVKVITDGNDRAIFPREIKTGGGAE